MDKQTYSPEEFAQTMRRRGYVKYIADARKYAKREGKTEFTEEDLENAYRAFNNGTIGREYLRKFGDDQFMYYRRYDGDLYLFEESREI